MLTLHDAVIYSTKTARTTETAAHDMTKPGPSASTYRLKDKTLLLHDGSRPKTDNNTTKLEWNYYPHSTTLFDVKASSAKTTLTNEEEKVEKKSKQLSLDDLNHNQTVASPIYSKNLRLKLKEELFKGRNQTRTIILIFQLLRFIDSDRLEQLIEALHLVATLLLKVASCKEGVSASLSICSHEKERERFFVEAKPDKRATVEFYGEIFLRVFLIYHASDGLRLDSLLEERAL